MNNARASNVSAEIFKDQAVLQLCDSCWANFLLREPFLFKNLSENLYQNSERK